MSSTAVERPPAAPADIPQGSPTLQDETMTMLWREAKALAAGRMFKDVEQAEQAFARMLVGHHLGLNPAQSMLGIDIVKGSAQLRGTLLGTLVRSREGYDWKVLEMGPEKASIEFFRDGESQGVSTWAKADSERAGLVKSDSNHEKYPTAMFWNRAMSQGVKLLVPETMRGIPVYTPDDLEGVTARGARDGEPGGGGSRSAPEDRTALLDAIIDHIPLDQQSRAKELIDEMNSLAPGSWGAAKVEMIFSHKRGYSVSVELSQIERQIEELRSDRDDVREVLAAPDEPENVTDAEVVPEQAVNAASDAEPSQEAQEQGDILKARESELEALYDHSGDGTREQEELGIELEQVREGIRDLGFTASIDVSPAQDSLPL
jgi:hypothetical protein